MRKLIWTTALALSLASSLAQAQEGDLTVVWSDDSTSDVTFDPRVTQSRHEEQVIVQIFDQLVTIDTDNKKYPGLAKSWTMAPDNKSVVLQLRDDVTFHDGTKFDAEAVKFTFDYDRRPRDGVAGRRRHHRPL